MTTVLERQKEVVLGGVNVWPGQPIKNLLCNTVSLTQTAHWLYGSLFSIACIIAMSGILRFPVRYHPYAIQ